MTEPGREVRRIVPPILDPRRKGPLCLDRGQLGAARDIVARYRDLRIGLADASLVILAERHRTRRILTFDERAFRAIAPLQGGAFTLLPADAA